MSTGDELHDQRKGFYWKGSNALFTSGAIASLQPSAFVVYCYLLFRAGQKKSAFPGVQTIAEDCGLGRTAVIEGIQGCESIGLISVEHKRGGGNTYTILDESHIQIGPAYKPNPETNELTKDLKPGRKSVKPVRKTDQSGKRTSPENGLGSPENGLGSPENGPVTRLSEQDSENIDSELAALPRDDQFPSEISTDEPTTNHGCDMARPVPVEQNGHAVVSHVEGQQERKYHEQIYETYCHTRGIHPYEKGVPVGKAMKLAKALGDVPLDDVAGCTRYVMSEDWRDATWDFGAVHAKMGGWIAAGRPSPEGVKERAKEVARRWHERQKTEAF